MKEGAQDGEGYPASPLWAPLPPDLCAVSVSSNEMAAGDIEVLPDTRKHERDIRESVCVCVCARVCVYVEPRSQAISLGLGYGFQIF